MWISGLAYTTRADPEGSPRGPDPPFSTTIILKKIFIKGALQRQKIQKSEITMEVGGWVEVSLGIFVENHPKIALNQY